MRIEGQQSVSKAPAPEGFAAWPDYWKAHGMPWRTEPEVDVLRQQFMTQCLATPPDEARGAYPFKGVTLTRADVEWLLATSPEPPRKGPPKTATQVDSLEGLDLRGADLRGVDLQHLPLSRLRGGLTATAWFLADAFKRDEAAVDLRGANLNRTLLDYAALRSAKLQGASLQYTHFENASLRAAQLADASARMQHQTAGAPASGTAAPPRPR